MDCETNDCRKEKRGCEGCFYQEKHSYILNLTTREELIKANIELLEQLEETIKENNEKDISIRMLKNELEKKDKIINTAKDYIANSTHIEHDGDEYGFMEWIEIDIGDDQFIDTLKDILDGDYKKENK